MGDGDGGNVSLAPRCLVAGGGGPDDRIGRWESIYATAATASGTSGSGGKTLRRQSGLRSHGRIFTGRAWVRPRPARARTSNRPGFSTALLRRTSDWPPLPRWAPPPLPLPVPVSRMSPPAALVGWRHPPCPSRRSRAPPTWPRLGPLAPSLRHCCTPIEGPTGREWPPPSPPATTSGRATCAFGRKGATATTGRRLRVFSTIFPPTAAGRAPLPHQRSTPPLATFRRGGGRGRGSRLRRLALRRRCVTTCLV